MVFESLINAIAPLRQLLRSLHFSGLVKSRFVILIEQQLKGGLGTNARADEDTCQLLWIN